MFQPNACLSPLPEIMYHVLYDCVAGAMRLPLPPKKDRPVREMIHYLTDYYAETKFRLKPVPFSNQSENAFYNFYGECTKISGKALHLNHLALIYFTVNGVVNRA